MSNEDIFEASKKGNLERVKYLIKGGIFRKSIDVNTQDNVKNKLIFVI